MEPNERLFRIQDKDDFFRDLRREIRRLRWCWAIFSLKSLSGFGLYRVGKMLHISSHIDTDFVFSATSRITMSIPECSLTTAIAISCSISQTPVV